MVAVANASPCPLYLSKNSDQAAKAEIMCVIDCSPNMLSESDFVSAMWKYIVYETNIFDSYDLMDYRKEIDLAVNLCGTEYILNCCPSYIVPSRSFIEIHVDTIIIIMFILMGILVIAIISLFIFIKIRDIKIKKQF